jgi:hypothetical protein
MAAASLVGRSASIVDRGESLDLAEDVGVGGVVAESVFQNGLRALDVARAILEELGQIEPDTRAFARRAGVADALLVQRREPRVVVLRAVPTSRASAAFEERGVVGERLSDSRATRFSTSRSKAWRRVARPSERPGIPRFVVSPIAQQSACF